MSKNILTVFLLCAIPVFTFSQVSDIRVFHSDVTIGKNVLTQRNIKATEYIFPKRVDHFYFDTVSGYITVLLRGLSRNGKWLKNKGDIVVFDIDNKQVKWSIKFPFQLASEKQFGSKIFIREFNKTFLLNIENGQRLWKNKNSIYLVNSDYNIGIGYLQRNSKKVSNVLHGIDLSTGKTIWHRTIDRNYGWNDLYYLNDSTLMIVADGLHTLNIKNGFGWDYNTSTGKDDYSGTVITDIAGIAVGILTGVGFYTTGHKVVSGIASNILSDTSGFYFVSKQRIAKINKQNGKMFWFFGINKSLACKSYIFLKDSLLYVVNMGYAFVNRRKVDMGVPYLSAFNKETGKQVFFNIISEKKKPIVYLEFKDDVFTIIFGNSVARYSAKSGALLRAKTYFTKKFRIFSTLLGRNIFKKGEDATFTNLRDSDTTKTIVLTDKEKILEIDSALNITDTINSRQLYVGYLKKDGFVFIKNDKETFILDSNFREVAKLNLSGKLFLTKDKLYGKQGQNILEIDLNNILKSN